MANPIYEDPVRHGENYIKAKATAREVSEKLRGEIRAGLKKYLGITATVSISGTPGKSAYLIIKYKSSLSEKNWEQGWKAIAEKRTKNLSAKEDQKEAPKVIERARAIRRKLISSLKESNYIYYSDAQKVFLSWSLDRNPDGTETTNPADASTSSYANFYLKAFVGRRLRYSHKSIRNTWNGFWIYLHEVGSHRLMGLKDEESHRLIDFNRTGAVGQTNSVRFIWGLPLRKSYYTTMPLVNGYKYDKRKRKYIPTYEKASGILFESGSVVSHINPEEPIAPTKPKHPLPTHKPVLPKAPSPTGTSPTKSNPEPNKPVNNLPDNKGKENPCDKNPGGLDCCSSTPFHESCKKEEDPCRENPCKIGCPDWQDCTTDGYEFCTTAGACNSITDTSKDCYSCRYGYTTERCEVEDQTDSCDESEEIWRQLCQTYPEECGNSGETGIPFPPDTGNRQGNTPQDFERFKKIIRIKDCERKWVNPDSIPCQGEEKQADFKKLLGDKSGPDDRPIFIPAVSEKDYELFKKKIRIKDCERKQVTPDSFPCEDEEGGELSPEDFDPFGPLTFQANESQKMALLSEQTGYSRSHFVEPDAVTPFFKNLAAPLGESYSEMTFAQENPDVVRSTSSRTKMGVQHYQMPDR